VFSQPRRAALLAYLALRARHGPERRDTLLGVFWPESDTDHARGALRSALHFLRVALGPDVIQSRGSEEIQLDLEVLSCDAVEFEQLCDAGDPAAALRLYGGDLLKGFFISEAPEFELWLDRERSRLRRRASDAARTLAAEAEADGESGLAILRLRHLLELAPTDEGAIRHLMQLLAAADNRGEALHVYFELQSHLEGEFGIQPAEETRALAETLRAGAAGSRAPVTGAATSAVHPEHEWPRSVQAPDEATADPEPAAYTTASVPAAGGRWRRRRVVVLVSLAAVLVLVAAAILLGPATADAPDPDVVAVLPFEYRGAAEHSYLAEGLADLLAANLNGAGELRAVDPRALLARARPGPHPMEARVARREAATHGAGLVVLGTVTEAAGRLRIAASLFGPGGRATPVAVEGPADDVLVLVDRLSLRLLQARGTTGLVQATLRTTHSVEALKAFLSGEAALRKADTHAAIDHYRRATELDSTFALAHYRLSSAAYRQGVARIPATAGDAALRHAGRLAREDSLLVAAWHHHFSGYALEAFRLYEEALVLRPSHVEAAFQLGELLFHWGPSIGIPAAEAEEPFRRVLAVEPNHIQAALHLTRLAARGGRPREVDSLVAGMTRADAGGTWEVELDALRAFLSASGSWQDRTIVQAGQVPNRDREILEHMAAFSYNLAAVERVTRNRLNVQRTPAEQVRLRLFLAHVQLARGRYRDAAHGMASDSAVPPARRLEYRAMMATLPFLALPAAAIDAVRNEIAAQPDPAPHIEGSPFAGRGIEYPHLLWPGIHRARRLYLLGALHVRLGDYDAANAVADSLIAGDDLDGRLARQYQRLTRARAAAADGRPAAALNALGPVQPPPARTFESLVDHDRPYERWLRAELLRESGRISEALRWYGTFPDAIARDLPYVAPSHLRRAEIHDSAGDRLQAAFHYQRFVDLWADADPELQPAVTLARDRLREIQPR
jgi:DNA-binding SARP family transcriptional activator/TolB-like protein